MFIEFTARLFVAFSHLCQVLVHYWEEGLHNISCMINIRRTQFYCRKDRYIHFKLQHKNRFNIRGMAWSFRENIWWFESFRFSSHSTRFFKARHCGCIIAAIFLLLLLTMMIFFFVQFYSCTCWMAFERSIDRVNFKEEEYNVNNKNNNNNKNNKKKNIKWTQKYKRVNFIRV